MKINSRKVLPFLYLFPAILILGVFVYYPIIENIYNSFFDWSVFKPDRAFVGLEYYKELFRDEIFWICLKQCLICIGFLNWTGVFWADYSSSSGIKNV